MLAEATYNILGSLGSVLPRFSKLPIYLFPYGLSDFGAKYFPKPNFPTLCQFYLSSFYLFIPPLEKSKKKIR